VIAETALLREQAFVDGRWTDADSGETFAVTNPANGEELARVPRMGAAETRRALEAAEAAFPGWRGRTAADRARILRRWADLMVEHLDDLALLLTLEQGKPLAESRGEIRYAASFVEWFANEAKRVAGRTIPTHIDGAHLGTVMEPVGVAALITPWNFPAAMITRKAAAAIAAGCAVVVKPAHETPFSALALAQLADEAGFPAGVFNVVLGEPQMAMETLVGDARVRAVSFTGSTRVGRLVTETAAKAGIRKIALELGGNAPFIVTEDADLDQAVRIAIGAKFQTSGQDCCAANRIFVAKPLYEAFVSRYANAVRELKTGPAFEPGVDVGPLMHQAAFDATAARVDDARVRGARIVAGGRPHALGGWFYEPTVIADAAPGMRVVDEENFAPISAVCAFDTLDEVIEKANDTEYGLAAYVCATRIDTIFQLVRRLDFAMVSVNGVKFTGAPIPFGGMKASGLGREGGAEGFEPFTETKYFCLGNLGLPVAATA
jgi:aspartate-semialdehyde dehydrogenase